jgi:hypothetical protein
MQNSSYGSLHFIDADVEFDQKCFDFKAESVRILKQFEWFIGRDIDETNFGNCTYEECKSKCKNDCDYLEYLEPKRQCLLYRINAIMSPTFIAKFQL